MKTTLSKFFFLIVILSMAASACQGGQLLSGPQVTVQIVYGSEKREWLEPLVEAYNAAGNTTAAGSAIRVEAVPMGSIESVNAILEGAIQPTVWSPASSVYLPLANAEWRRLHGADLVEGTPNDLVLSPVVIAMWRSMAEALGWPQKALGWGDIAELAISPEGWNAYGFPEWGSFKFGHTHPNYSNSGIVAIIAQTYAGAGKQRGLTRDDLNNPDVASFMSEVQASIIHYGTSTGFFGERMFERGPSYLSAAVLYENLVVAQESKRIAGTSTQLPVVAIYPKEGTFWSNHPYVVLNTTWVSAEQKEAARAFEAFLLAREQQLKALALGFRPADPAIPLTAPLDAQHGVDPGQPQTILEVPTSEVIAGIQELWKLNKKPVDLMVVMDISGSMGGEKISSARSSLMQFIEQLDERDRLQVMLFNQQVTTLTPLTEIGPKRQQILQRVSGVIEGGGTSLYDATLAAYRELQANGDPGHIRAIVVLSDGQDTESGASLAEVLQAIGVGSEEGGTAIKLFTIAFGDDADTGILQQIAEISGGRQYDSNPENIRRIYGEIATFF
jgi:Ca-activated chloride channel family protein